MTKKQLSEQEIRTRFVTPAIQNAGWKPQQIREEVTFTAGRIIVRGTMSMRSKDGRKRVDCVLHYKPNIPLALVEGKDNNHAMSAGMSAGMDQVLEYAEAMDVPFVYTSNGDGFMEHDRIVDECHRGSAAEDSAWREVLEYFSSKVQIGLTATPKETEDVSNIDYFGEPIYTYSLRQGIEDGFLAPYKVIRIDLDKGVDGWRPERYDPTCVICRKSCTI